MFQNVASHVSDQQHALMNLRTISGVLLRYRSKERKSEMLSTVLIVVLILLLIGALPTWGYSSGWGYGPGGLLGTILIIVVILALLGRI
jgi:hypothetical protein